MKYGLIVCAVVIVGLGIAIAVLNGINNDLQTELNTTRQSLSNCNAALELQNAKVTEANAKLESFQSDIDSVRAKFNKKSKELDKALANVNTCESAMEYLKSSLMDLKGL